MDELLLKVAIAKLINFCEGAS